MLQRTKICFWKSTFSLLTTSLSLNFFLYTSNLSTLFILNSIFLPLFQNLPLCLPFSTSNYIPLYLFSLPFSPYVYLSLPTSNLIPLSKLNFISIPLSLPIFSIPLFQYLSTFLSLPLTVYLCLYTSMSFFLSGSNHFKSMFLNSNDY